ncbi:MAG: hydrogenase nickel incorporation protein HypA [Candidatus Latescibacterota bacterium]
MHELALAEAVVTAALEAARQQGMQRVARIGVSIGELQQIEREVFAQALRECMPAAHPELAGVGFELRPVAARLRCRSCTRSFGLAECPVDGEESEAIHFLPELAHTFLRCPDCGSPDFEVVEGRGVWLDCVEGQG